MPIKGRKHTNTRSIKQIEKNTACIAPTIPASRNPISPINAKKIKGSRDREILTVSDIF